MPTDLPPQYDPHAVESRIYQQWLASGAFHAAPDARPPEQRYSIVIPPPNVTGALHLGHAINGTIQDILTRYHRMKGDNTLWMPGIDHAGIATQAVVEKTIFEKEHKSRHDLGRDELVRRIWEWKEKFGTRILTQLQSIGASCDWDRTRFTLDDTCAKAVREAFFKMFKDGLIFRGKRLVNWDTHLQTAVADDEIYHETIKGQMTSIKYPVDSPRLAGGDAGETEFLVVATTRPETMLGDTAVAVHPDDPRYQHLIGKHVIVPLVGRKIPIIADGQLVDPKFGTGVVKVTPAHDPSDYATGLRHNLEQINLLTPDGKVNENGAGEFLGKKYSYTGQKFATAARKQVLEDLEKLNLIADQKPHEHEVGHSDRSKTPIEPYLSDQWFVRMGDIATNANGAPDGNPGPSASQTNGPSTDNAKAPHSHAGLQGITLGDGARSPGLAQAAIDAVQDGRVKITPERYAKGYTDWLSQKRDWCISRQLWWGHRIPVWVFLWNGPIATSPSDSQQVRMDLPFLTREQNKHIAAQVIRPGTSAGEILIGVTVRPGFPEIEHAIASHGGEQEPDVLDTWFSSALWPLSTMGWPNSIENQKSKIENPTNAPEPGLLDYFYPTSLLSTGRDILTLWVARMVMFGLYCRGDVPFRNVYIHTTIQDGEGRPMKKTLGNGLDPVDVVASHGADAMRFTLASMSTDTQDVRMPLVKDPKTGNNTSVKFDLGRNFANKIWNAARFILSNLPDSFSPGPWAGVPAALEDRWILSRLNAAISQATQAIETYRFAELADNLRSFFWTDLCDWYLEIAKARIKSGDATVQSVLLHCLKTSLQLLHPIMPFITEELWSKLPQQKIENPGDPAAPHGNAGLSPALLITAPWPKADPAAADPAAESQIGLIQSVTTAIREIQNRYPAAKGKPVILQPREPATQQTLHASRSIIEPLTGAAIAEISATAQKPDNAATAVLPDAGGIQIFIAGVIDKSAESAKITKRLADLEKQILSGRNKLGNEAFAAKAPPKIIQGLRDQLAKQESEFAALQKNLEELQ